MGPSVCWDQTWTIFPAEFFPKARIWPLVLAKKARFLIVHGGIGSVGLAISLRKKAIAVPRLKKFDEAINDHQFQIIKEFAKEKKIIPSYEVADLKEAIGKIKTFKPNFTKEENKLRGLILQFIAKMQK